MHNSECSASKVCSVAFNNSYIHSSGLSVVTKLEVVRSLVCVNIFMFQLFTFSQFPISFSLPTHVHSELTLFDI